MGRKHWRKQRDRTIEATTTDDTRLRSWWKDFGDTLLADLVYHSDFMGFVNTKYKKILYAAWMTEGNTKRLRPDIAWQEGQGVVVNIRAEEQDGDKEYLLYRFYPYVHRTSLDLEMDVVIVVETVNPSLPLVNNNDLYE